MKIVTGSPDFAALHQTQSYYHYSPSTQSVAKFSSQAEHRKDLLRKTNEVLSGCIEKHGNLGRLEITPFRVTIKALDADYDFSHDFKTHEWSSLIGWL